MNTPQPIKPLTGSRLKIARAKSHLNDLGREVSQYRDRNPYRIVQEINGNRTQYRLRVEVREPPPQQLGVIVGDIIHALRSALDLLATDLARLNGATKLTDTYFPIAADRQVFEADAIRKIKRLSPEAQRLIGRLQPYKGGRGHALWQLHQLDILDKHTVLVPVGSLLALEEFSFAVVPSVYGYSAATVKMEMGPKKYPLHDGDVIVSWPNSAETPAQIHVKPTFDVAFGEGQIVEGQPVIPALQQFVDLVERIVSIVERRFPRYMLSSVQ